MDAPRRTLVFALSFSLAGIGLFTGCKRPPKGGRQIERTVKASIAEFDPNEDIVLDLDKYGTARVDEWEVQQAFSRSFEALDACVLAAKKELRLPEDRQLGGDVDFAVKLNPESAQPLGVNAQLSDEKLDGNDNLKTCLKKAVAEVGYPTYDGPPSVAEFYTQLDPGYAEVDE